MKLFPPRAPWLCPCPGGVTFWVTPSFPWLGLGGVGVRVACGGLWAWWPYCAVVGVWCGWWGALAAVPLRSGWRILVGDDGSMCSPFPFLSFPESTCFLVVLGVVSCIWGGCFRGVSCMFVLLPGCSAG